MSDARLRWLESLKELRQLAGIVAGLVVVFAVLTVIQSGSSLHFPWLAYWLTAILAAVLVVTVLGWNRSAREQAALATALALLPLGMMLHGLWLVGQQATRARLEVLGEYRAFVAGAALSFGRDGSDVPLGSPVPEWGAPELRIVPLAAARRDGTSYAATATDSIDFVLQDDRVLYGLPVRNGSWIRAGTDSVRVRMPGFVGRWLGRGASLAFHGRTIPLAALNRRVVGVDVRRGASLGDLAGEWRDSLPRELRRTRLVARHGRSAYLASHDDPRGFRVDGVALQDTFWLREGKPVQLGVGRQGSRFSLERRSGPQGTDLLLLRYQTNPGVRRWQLPSGSEPGVPPAWRNHLVLTSGDIAGSFSSLNFAGLPLAASTRGILGRLDRDDGTWSLKVGSGGKLGGAEFLPVRPDGTAGFILGWRGAPLRLGHFALLCTLLWGAAMTLLVWGNRGTPAARGASRGADRPLFATPSLLFCIVPILLALLALRTVLSARAVYLPPHRDEVLSDAVLPWLLFPGLTFLLAYWPTLLASASAVWIPGRRRSRAAAAAPRNPALLAAGWVGMGALACSVAAPAGAGVRSALLYVGFVTAFAVGFRVLSQVLVLQRRRAQEPDLSPFAPFLRPDTVRIAASRPGRGRSLLDDIRNAVQGGTWQAILLMALLIAPILVAGVSVLVGRIVLALAVYWLLKEWRAPRGPERGPSWLLPVAGAGAAFAVFGVLPFATLRVTGRYFLLLGTLLVAVREFAVLAWSSTVDAPAGRRHGGGHRLLLALRWLVPSVVALLLLAAAALTDFGIALYVVPVLLGILVLMASVSARIAAGLAVALVVALPLAFRLATPGASSLGTQVGTVQSGPTPHLHEFASSLQQGPGPVALRNAATFHPEALERALAYTRSAEEEVDVRRTVEHWWGMRSYSRQGWLGRGVGGAPIEGRGIPMAVSLSDNTFATLVLAEEGAWGGAALLLLFITLFALAVLSMLRGVPRAGEDRDVGLALVVALGLVLLVPALYLAASNAVLVPLTGQNVPFLALNSAADAFFASTVAALLVALLARFPAGGPAVFLRASERGASAALAAALVGLLATLAGVGTAYAVARAALSSPPGDLRYTNLRDELERITDDGILVRDTTDGTLVVARTGRVGALASSDETFLGRNRMLFNLDQRSTDRADSLLALTRPSVFLPDGARGVHARPGEIYGVRDPMEEARAVWYGTLAEAGPREKGVLLLGARRVLLLTPGDSDVELSGSACGTEGMLRARSIRIACGGGESYLTWQGDREISVEGRNARLNGRPVRGAATARDGDLLTVPGVGRLVVDEGDTGLLSGARWEDGRLMRFATPGFAMARALAWRIDEGVQRNGGAEGRDVTLSLNLGLSTRLGARLAAFAAARPAIQSMAVTVMDARTGEVVALAGWSRSAPVRVGPLCPDSSALDEAGEESATALRLNFTPHFPGSTVKPLMAAAAFSRYPVLRTLQVTHPGVPKAPQIAGLPATRPGWDGLDIATEARCVSDGSNGTRVITPQLFLTCSSNLYEATLTFLASARPAPDSTRPGLGGEGRWAYAAQLEGQPLRRWPALEGLGGCTAGACRITPGHLQPSPLAGELSRLFDVSTSQRQAERGDGGYDTALWAALDSAGMLTPSRHRRNQVSACAAEPLFDQVRSTDELARFAIGAQDNRWTNVKLAEAFARVVTGRRVRATLVREVGGARVTAPAPPLGGDSLWRAPITAGLLRAADVGTARALRPFPAEVRQALRARGDSTGMEFNLAAKTGTLNDAGAHLKVLVAAAGFWTRGRTAAELACGVTLALHVVYSPTGARLPSEQLQLAAQEVLPALRDHFRWDDPARARRCSTTR